jgi:hypothetical protein
MSWVVSRVKAHFESLGPGSLYAFDPDSLQQSAELIPGQMEAAVIALREVSLGADLQQALKLSWLNHVTGCGFIKVPPPLPIMSLPEDQTVRGQPRYPAVVLPWAGGKLAISANGHTFEVKDSPAVRAVVERLNSGAAYQVGRLVDVCAGQGRGEDARLARQVIEKLYSLRAVTSSPTIGHYSQ